MSKATSTHKNKRTNRQIIDAIKCDIAGVIEVVGYLDIDVLMKMTDKRYNIDLVRQAVGEVSNNKQ